MQPRVTIRDIAQKARVHFTTVSMALRNHPRIPEATKERIRKIADKMGYRPDAMLSALSDYRQSQRTRTHQATLAWINNHPVRERLLAVGLYEQYYRGAAERAEQLGFKLEEFWLREPGMTRARMATILRTRGIRGVLVAPLPGAGMEIDLLPWEQIAAVTFGFSLSSPQLNRVAPNQYHTMRTILSEVRKLGYRRIGFIMSRDFDQRCDGNWQAAFWVDYHAQPVANRVEPFWHESEEIDEEAVAAWLREQRPEVLVPTGGHILATVRHLGYRIPEDIGLVNHNITPAETYLSGMDENGLRTGAVAMEMLVAMVNRQEFGIPAIPQQSMVEGIWMPGQTLRRMGG
jgi:LacI family transcriptional regulator